MRIANSHSGFSLIELAIVLLVIGLLLSGILKGQELLNSTKTKSLLADFTNASRLVYSYQDRYRRLPGDDPSADAHVGVSSTSNGNGDNQIDGHWDDAPSGGVCPSEACNLWLHVRLAGLDGGTTVIDSNYQPTNSEGGPLGVASTAPVAGWAGNFFVCSGGIQGRFARQIDVAIDDGATHAGSVRAIGGTPAAFQTLTSAEDAAFFTVCAAY
jgi:prepilin-type N-terminal cleavage/methylation domain-containing protein